MSQIDVLVKNEQIIPVVESRLFVDHPDARFAVGMIAVGEQVLPGYEEELLGYHKLRAGVYAYQTNMLDHSLVREDGTEYDHDDERSNHFAIVENLGQSQRIVAAMRLIKKGEDGQSLPIEEFFTEAFENNPAPAASLEVSRYICRHEDREVQNSLKWPLYTRALGHILSNNLGPTYAVIEEFLQEDLKKNKVPFTAIAEPKYVEEYNDENLGVVIDTQLLAERMEKRHPGIIDMLHAADSDFTYFGTVPNADKPNLAA